MLIRRNIFLKQRSDETWKLKEKKCTPKYLSCHLVSLAWRQGRLAGSVDPQLQFTVPEFGERCWARRGHGPEHVRPSRPSLTAPESRSVPLPEVHQWQLSCPDVRGAGWGGGADSCGRSAGAKWKVLIWLERGWIAYLKFYKSTRAIWLVRQIA